jgi:hypothetical protein
MTHHHRPEALYNHWALQHNKNAMLKDLRFYWKTLFLSFSHITLWAIKPHPLAFKQYGIRIVAMTHDPRQEEELCNGAYEALMLLEQHDRQMFDRVKKYIRIICLSPTNGNANTYRTFGLYFISGLRFPAGYSTKKLPITIGGFVVWQATLAKLKGCMATDDQEDGAAILKLCRKRYLLTRHKLEKTRIKS